MDGDLYYICGSSRNGKSVIAIYIMLELLKKLGRALVWDIEGEYGKLPGFTIIRDKKSLFETLKKTKGKGRFAYQGSLKDYDFFCKTALAWGDKKPCVVVLEETSDVTNPGKAPDGHGQLMRKGLKRGIEILAITQRPSESDKTALGNATQIITFYMTRAADQKYIADEIGVNRSDISALRKLEYLKNDTISRKITRGKLEFA